MTNVTSTAATLLANLPTAEQAKKKFEDAGLFGPALDWAVKTGAFERHMARVTAAKAVALEEAKRLLPEARDLQVEVLAFILTWAELRGEGGPSNLGGDDASTVRLSWAQVLGKGRRKASDGPAWDAALAEAGSGLAEQLRLRGVATIRIAPSGEERILVSTEDLAGSEEPVAGFEVWLPPSLTRDLVGRLARWSLAEVAGVACNLPPPMPFLAVQVELEGSARDWAAVWNWAETAAPYEVGVAWASRQNKAGRDIGSGDDPEGADAARAAGAALGYEGSALSTFVRGAVTQYRAECSGQ
jgi:hypothetical protein